MQRDTLEVAVVAVLCILALSVAAATLQSAEGSGGGGGIIGTIMGWLPIPNPTAQDAPEDVGVPEVDGQLADTLSPLQALFCIPALRDPTVQVAILVGFLAVVGGILWKGDLLQAGTGLAVLAAPTVLFAFIFAFTMRGCTAETADIDAGERSAGVSGGSGAGDAIVTTVMDDPALLVLGVGLLGLVVAAVALVGSAGDDEGAAADEGEEPSPSGPPSVVAVAEAAGTAADRIEADGEVDNEVYRAWREMTDDLDVPNPDASTPAEFRRTAIEAGIAREDVDELTAMFEDVRYGGEAATAEREERAVEALRRIERDYGDGGQ